MQSTLRTGVAVAALALIPVADAAAASYGSRPLREGTSGSDVKRLQRYLDRAGYDTSADGIFGPATARSVRSFEIDEDRRPNAAATRYEQRLVRARAASRALDGGAGGARATGAPAPEGAYMDATGRAGAPASAPAEVQAII